MSRTEVLADKLKPFVSKSTRRRILSVRSSLRRPTSSRRVLPDALIIGGMRCGTSSLYKYLGQHPSTAPSLRKEVQYFSVRYGNGIDWYRSNFPTRTDKMLRAWLSGHQCLALEATPDYLFHPYAAERAAELLPEAKLIVLLRDPVERAYSHYLHNIKHGNEPLSFEEAIDREQERLTGEEDRLREDPLYSCDNYRLFSYVARGKYVDQLATWLALYPRDSFLIVRSEDLFGNTAEIYQQVLEFLGLPSWQPSAFVNHSRGPGANSRRHVPDDVRRRLHDVFAPYNKRLEDLLGRAFNWAGTYVAPNRPLT